MTRNREKCEADSCEKRETGNVPPGVGHMARNGTQGSEADKAGINMNGGDENNPGGGAENNPRGGAENNLRGGAENNLRGGAENNLRGGAENNPRGGAKAILKSNAPDLTVVEDKMNTRREASSSETLEVESNARDMVEIFAKRQAERDEKGGAEKVAEGGAYVDIDAQCVPESNAQGGPELNSVQVTGGRFKTSDFDTIGSADNGTGTKSSGKGSPAGQEVAKKFGAATSNDGRESDWSMPTRGGASDGTLSTARDMPRIKTEKHDIEINARREKEIRRGSTTDSKVESFVDERNETSLRGASQPLIIKSKSKFEFGEAMADDTIEKENSELQAVIGSQHVIHASRSDLERDPNGFTSLEKTSSSLVQKQKANSQREAQEFDLSETTGKENGKKSGIDENEREDLVISCDAHDADDHILYTCSPENFSPARVTFQVGGDDEDESQNNKAWNSLEGRGAANNGHSRSNRYLEPVSSLSLELSPTGSRDRQKTGYHGPHSFPGFDSYGRVSGRKRVSIELPKGIFSDHTRINQPDMTGKTRKRVSIEEPQGRRFVELPGPSSQPNLINTFSKTYSLDSSSDHPVNAGILKHSASAPRQDFGHCPDTKEVNDGMMRYRRRSQLTLSPDIPTDVPLKHRQLENEVRNKNNLAFIRRRVSLQEDQKFSSSADLRMRDIREIKPLPPASQSFLSPGNDMYFEIDRLNDMNDRPVRKSGLGHLNVSRSGYSGSSSESVHGSFSRVNDSNNSPSHGHHFDVYPNRIKDTQLQAGGLSDKDPSSSRHSREGSVASSNIAIEREIDEAEIVDYLGNIQPEWRRYVFPLSPRSHQHGSASPSSPTTTVVSGQNGLGAHHGVQVDVKSDGNDDDDSVFVKDVVGGDEDPSMQPYVPIRRERISFQPRAQAGQIWTVRGHDNKAFQAFPGIS